MEYGEKRVTSRYRSFQKGRRYGNARVAAVTSHPLPLPTSDLSHGEEMINFRRSVNLMLHLSTNNTACQLLVRHPTTTESDIAQDIAQNFADT